MTDSLQDQATEVPEPAASGDGENASAHSSWVGRPGRVLAGKYREGELLGRGGMGVVVAGVQLDLERPVAIKFLRPELAQNARPAKRFALEARAIAKMRSEHVVRVFDVGEIEGVPFIVMERLNGNDLAAELKRGPLPLALTVEYGLQACEALAEAHSLGIIHRDLKPSNLFLAEGFDGRRRLKVLDFGVSKWLGPLPQLDSLQSTSEGSLLGTPGYVSPEQLTRPDAVDQRTDVWALGVVLYQCLSGRLPFDGDSVPRLCAQILTAAPARLPGSLSLPDGLERVILDCLQKDPAERPPTVVALSRALARFASAPLPPREGTPARRRSWRWFALPAALGLLLSWLSVARRGNQAGHAEPEPKSPPALVAPTSAPPPQTAGEPPPSAPAAPSSSAALTAAPGTAAHSPIATRALPHAPTPRAKASAAPALPAEASAPARAIEAAPPKPDPLDPAQLYRR
ncbi:MAG: protein kinase [Myxococcales bacterium]